MFELPDAKRIKRADLNTSDNGSVDGLENSGQRLDNEPLNGNDAPLDYGFEYDFVETTNQEFKADATEPPQETPSYHFRLFSSASKPISSTPAAEEQIPPSQLITLTRSPSPSAAIPEQEGRLLRPRPTSHYFTTPSSPSTQSRFQTTAISPSSLLSLAHTPWPGTSLPWRATTISPTQLHKSLRTSFANAATTTPHPDTATTHDRHPGVRRTKPNKSRRIILRRRVEARRQLLAKAAASQPKPKPVKKPNAKGEMEYELTTEEREKRRGRNREKKVKRRERERERKKLAAAEGAAGGGGGERPEEVGEGDEGGGSSGGG